MPLLPTTKVPASFSAPRCIVFYSLPKSGKTTVIADLPDCLILDCEGGTDLLDAIKVKLIGLKPLPWETEEQKQIRYNGIVNKEGNKEFPLYFTEVIIELRKSNPYKFLALDTVTSFEAWCEEDATITYMNSPIGKNFNRYSKLEAELSGGAVVEGELKPKGKQMSVLSLPDGAGYLYLRNSAEKWIGYLKEFDSYLIITAHLRFMTRVDKVGKETAIKDIDLTGKVKRLVGGLMADAIGYIYRKENRLFVSFESGEEILAGNRSKKLDGRNILLSEKIETTEEIKTYWKQIYPMLA